MQYAELMAPCDTDPRRSRCYEQDLIELRSSERSRRVDRARSHNIALALSGIHAEKGPRTSYCRGVARALGGDDGMAHLAETDDHPILRPERLERIEIALVRWRWLLRAKQHRSRRIHGTLLPENIFFRGEECTLLEPPPRRGEPAQDVAAITLRFVVAALCEREKFTGAARDVWDEFWSSYLSETNDLEIMEVIPPFYAREALEIVALNAPEPLSESVQRTLVEFAEMMLAGRPFRPDHLDGILP